MSDTRSNCGSDRLLIWDLPLRICHWLLALCVLGAWLTHRLGTQAFQWHVAFGYATLILVAFRIAWGFLGPAHARFGNFLRGPRAVLRYVRTLPGATSEHHAGHNPVGGWMVVLLLVLLAVVSATGLFANDEIINTGALYGYVSDAGSDVISTWHRRLVDVLWVAMWLHIAAVFAYLLIKRDNLIGPMFTGYKRALSSDWVAIKGSQLLLALAIAAACAIVLFIIIETAPEPSMLLF